MNSWLVWLVWAGGRVGGWRETYLGGSGDTSGQGTIGLDLRSNVRHCGERRVVVVKWVCG